MEKEKSDLSAMTTRVMASVGNRLWKIPRIFFFLANHFKAKLLCSEKKRRRKTPPTVEEQKKYIKEKAYDSLSQVNYKISCRNLHFFIKTSESYHTSVYANAFIPFRNNAYHFAVESLHLMVHLVQTHLVHCVGC